MSGTVIDVGSSVTKLKAGDAVYASLPPGDQGTLETYYHNRLLTSALGSVAEFVATTSAVVARKPPSLTHIQAASLPLVALTALQAFDKAEKLIPGGLRGRTVFVPAGLSGTGSIALQLAKNVFGADRVITTVSTAKVSQVGKFLGAGVVDQIVDYKTQDVLKEIPKGSVDFMFDTMGGTISYVSVMRPETGLIISISTVPSGDQIQEAMGPLPFWLKYMLNGADNYYRFRVGRWNIKYENHTMQTNSVDLERVSKWIDEKKLLPVIGRVTSFSDLEGIRSGCDEIYKAKGGIGKFVIEVV